MEDLKNVRALIAGRVAVYEKAIKVCEGLKKPLSNGTEKRTTNALPIMLKATFALYSIRLLPLAPILILKWA